MSVQCFLRYRFSVLLTDPFKIKCYGMLQQMIRNRFFQSEVQFSSAQSHIYKVSDEAIQRIPTNRSRERMYLRTVSIHFVTLINGRSRINLSVRKFRGSIYVIVRSHVKTICATLPSSFLFLFLSVFKWRPQSSCLQCALRNARGARRAEEVAEREGKNTTISLERSRVYTYASDISLSHEFIKRRDMTRRDVCVILKMPWYRPIKRSRLPLDSAGIVRRKQGHRTWRSVCN